MCWPRRSLTVTRWLGNWYSAGILILFFFFYAGLGCLRWIPGCSTRQKNSFRASVAEYKVELEVNHLSLFTGTTSEVGLMDAFATRQEIYSTLYDEQLPTICPVFATFWLLLQILYKALTLLEERPQRDLNASFCCMNNTIWLHGSRSAYYTMYSECKFFIHFNGWINVFKLSEGTRMRIYKSDDYVKMHSCIIMSILK